MSDEKTKPSDKRWAQRLEKQVTPCCRAGLCWVTESGDCRNCGSYVSELDQQYRESKS